MKVLYLNGVDRSRDEATTRQLVDAEPSLKLTIATSPPDAFAQIREAGDIDALVTSPAVARSETLALIVSLRRDKVPVVIVPVVTESQSEFATAAIAAGADDVLLQLGGTLLNAPETLSRVMKVNEGPARDSARLQVLYVGDDDLVWSLLDQLSFVDAARAVHEAAGDPPVRPPAADSTACDVVVVDALDDEGEHRAVALASRHLSTDGALLVLTPPTMSEDAAAALELRGSERIPKTGLYRRPLVTALERLHARKHGAPVTPDDAREPATVGDVTTEAPQAAQAAPPAAIEHARAIGRIQQEHQAALDTLRAGRDDAWQQADAAREERDSLKADLERTRRELEEARAASTRDADERAAEIAAWEAERAGWEAEREAWQAERRGLDEQAREARELASHGKRDLEAALDTVRAELDAERETSEAARADLERVREELQGALDEARSTLEAERTEAAGAREAAVAEARRDAEAARRDLAAARTHREEAGRWHDAQRAAWEQARSELEARLAELQAELDGTRGDLETRLAAAEARAQDLSVQLASQPAALAAARMEAAEAHQRFVRRGLFGHALMTRGGHLVECNDTFARLFGQHTAGDLLREYGDRPFTPLTNRDVLDARLMSNGHAHGVESCLERADGQPVRVLESAARIDDPARGELIERVLIDMRDHAVLEDRLHRAKRVERVGTLAAEMGPDIDAALTAAMDAVKRAGTAGSLETRGDLDAAAAATERAAGLVRQLLAFSRRQQRAAESIDVSRVVRGAEAMLRSLVGADIALDMHAAEPQSIMAADEDLSHLLTALTVQARDLLPLGGTVRVATTMASARTSESGLHARHVVLRVVATGYGVGTPQITDALDVMADRCGGSITALHDAGREAGFEVAFSRCVPSDTGVHP